MTNVQTLQNTYTYELYFSLGQNLKLAPTPDVFKVSLTGIKLGNHLVQRLNPKILSRIRDALDRHSQKDNNAPPSRRLIERHTFPLIHYSSQWQALSAELELEFKNWEAQDLAAFSTDSKITIYGSYEVIEFFHCQTPQP